MSAEIKEHPILFSAEMAKAILVGKKVMTRRVVKHRISPEWWEPKRSGVWTAHDTELSQEVEIRCPYGEASSRLYIKEPYQLLARWDDQKSSEVPEDCRLPIRYPWTDTVVGQVQDHFKFGRIRAGRFMPRWASRLTLEIVGVRVERLQEISIQDCIMEGAPIYEDCPFPRHDVTTWFEELWNEINCERGYGWDVNPFCWVVEFRTLETGK